MKFIETSLADAYLIKPELLSDERGFFARSFCGDEFKKHGLRDRFVQCNISFNHSKNTVRGMHYQKKPHEEAKLVRCTMGAIYDVIVDIRPSSPTYKKWEAFELTADNRYMLYVPEGFAHGFQTLTDNSEVFYQMSEFFVPGVNTGFNWKDPEIAIDWPKADKIIISEKDRDLPDLV